MILYIFIFCTTDEGSCIAAETFGIKNILLIGEEKKKMSNTTQPNHSGLYKIIDLLC